MDKDDKDTKDNDKKEEKEEPRIDRFTYEEGDLEIVKQPEKN